VNRFATVFYDPELKTVRVYLDGQYMCEGRRLRRASFIRPDDAVMEDKLKLQAYQRRLNSESLDRLRAEAPPELGSTEATILHLTRGESEQSTDVDETFEEPRRAPAETLEPIPLNEEERYRGILRKVAAGESISDEDRIWQAEYEASQHYEARQQIYQAEFEYMQYQAERSAQ
ncbi:MAG: hypothetical protein JRG97_15600, partial [Deltaproteobacteria bacterium]|nr:hypothetical protein [Deltaproteobacteria bacterium]